MSVQMKFTKTEDVDVIYMGDNFQTLTTNILQSSIDLSTSSYALSAIPTSIRYRTFADGKGNLYNLDASDAPSELLIGQEISIERRFIPIFGKKIVLSKKLKAKI